MTAKPIPQWKQMRDVLIERGPRGVHTFELRNAGIGNPSERHRELEAMGFVITSTREAFGENNHIGVRYKLVDRGRGTTAEVRHPVERFDGLRCADPRAREHLEFVRRQDAFTRRNGERSYVIPARCDACALIVAAADAATQELAA